MLTIQETSTFINGLVIAGLRPFGYEEELRRKMAEDMVHYFSYASGEELLQVGEALKANTHWPTYREIEEELKRVIKQKEPQEELELEDAYPEGQSWEGYTRSRLEQQLPKYKDSLSEASLLYLHWYFEEKQGCCSCEGKSCSYSGHRPRLRISDNYREVYPCVEQELCPKFVATHRQPVDVVV